MTSPAPLPLRALGLLGLVTIATGCAALLPAPEPVATIPLVRGAAPGRTLVVLLPGRFDDAADFSRRGFVAAAREAGVDADLVAVQATLGYYARRTVLTRLREDIVLPARARGYARVYLAGVSMGGLGGLLYARHHGDEIDGVLAIAPFLGAREVVDEIVAAGGLAAWSPPPGPTDDFRGLWRWLKGASAGDVQTPPLWLAWGETDEFARANRLLADTLPPDRVFTDDGGHDWAAWRRLWDEWLRRGPLTRTVPAATR